MDLLKDVTGMGRASEKSTRYSALDPMLFNPGNITGFLMSEMHVKYVFTGSMCNLSEAIQLTFDLIG